MNKKIEKYYHQELAYLREQGDQFAKAHPKTAKQLRLGASMTEDPFVGRLLSSFSFLTASLRVKMDDEQTVLHRSLLEVLYPHYLLPVPSMTTIQMQASMQLDQAYMIERDTVLSLIAQGGEICQFSTCYPVTLWPLLIDSCRYQHRSPVKSQLLAKTIKSCLQFRLSTNKPSLLLHELSIDNLRLHYHFDEAANAAVLFNLFFKYLQSIVISYGGSPVKTIELPVSLVKFVGFDRQQNLLHYPEHSFKGFSLLTEYFVYPQKFFYIDLSGLDRYLTAEMAGEINIHFLFSHLETELESSVLENTIRLFCTPLVNLFPVSAEPIRLDHRHSDYHVIADARQTADEIEVYRVVEMVLTSSNQQDNRKCLPYYGEKFFEKSDDSQVIYWQGARKSCQELGEHQVPGSEMFVSFSLPEDENSLGGYTTITPKIMATNRELPLKIIVNNQSTEIKFVRKNHEVVESIRCLSECTAPKYRSFDQESLRMIISHLHLNHLSFEDSKIALKALKNTLLLYYIDDEGARWIEDGLISLSAKHIVQRHPEKLRQGFCQGVELSLEINENFFPQQQAILFGEILHQYLSHSCSVNSFILLIIVSQQHGEVHRWPPSLGIKTQL